MDKKAAISALFTAAFLVSTVAGVQGVEANSLGTLSPQISDYAIINAGSTIVGQPVTLSATLSDPLKTQARAIAQSGTQVRGIINHDAIWTKANSPYNLTGYITVDNNVTLTIESGVKVNLNTYSITVNGSLHARGSITEPIYFNSQNPDSDQIVFTNFSENWNNQTGTGCIIENSVISSIFMYANSFSSDNLNVYHVSPMINNNIIRSIHVTGGEPTFSNNTITGKILISQGQPKFLHNNITDTIFGSFLIWGGAPEISYNTIACGIQERSYFYPAIGHTISYNTIYGGGIDIDHYTGSVAILHNTLVGAGYGQVLKVIGIPSEIVNNTITGRNDVGIFVPNMDSLISNNTLQNCTTGIVSGKNATIENNAVFNNSENGIEIQAGSCIIKNNTIADNSIGILLNSSDSQIYYNNLHSNRLNSIYLSNISSDIDAINNWWGTTDSQVISNTIYDFKNASNLGRVNFVPFLAELNYQAPTIPATPNPLPTPTQSPNSHPATSPTEILNPSISPTDYSTQTLIPTPTGTVPEFPVGVLLILLITTSTLLTIYKKRGTKR